MSISKIIDRQIKRYGTRARIYIPSARVRADTQVIINTKDVHNFGSKRYLFLRRRSANRTPAGDLSGELAIFAPYHKLWETDADIYVIIGGVGYIVNAYTIVPFENEALYIQAFLSAAVGTCDDYDPIGGAPGA